MLHWTAIALNVSFSFDDQLGLATREQSPVGADLDPVGSLLRSESSEADAEVVTSAEDVSPGHVAGKVPEVAADRLANLDQGDVGLLVDTGTQHDDVSVCGGFREEGDVVDFSSGDHAGVTVARRNCEVLEPRNASASRTSFHRY